MKTPDWIYLCVIVTFIGAFVANWYGCKVGMEGSADAAVSDDPPSWWKQELIKARARKDVAAERAKEKR